ncbi:MAG TPA: glycosyltransferase [Longimicrobiales bacterium]
MSHPRTILHVIDTGGPGGAETVFSNLVTGLTKQGWSAIAVVPVRDWLWGELESHGIQPVYLPSAGSFDLTYLRGLARIAKHHRADLIQTHLFSSAVYGTIAAKLNGLPVVCTHHGTTDIATSGSYRQIKFRIVRRRQNHHVFVSHDLKQRFADGHIIHGRNARVIHNGIDTDVFRPERDEGIRAELNVGPTDILVGAVGNLRTPKDYPTLVRAAADLAGRSPRYHFVIAGAADEPLRSQLQQMIGELGLDGRFKLIGFRPDVHRVMNALDIYALSSSTEGFSLTTVQAMACGVPVVATRCGGPEEILVDGRYGTLVPPGNARALADGIHALGEDAARRAAFASAGRTRAVSEFSIAAMISQYADLYRESIAARATAHSA